MPGRFACLIVTLPLCILAVPAAAAERREYRLPSIDLKQQVIWGAVCEEPEGAGLAFGGQDQKADDGRPHTHLKRAGRWVNVRDELRAGNPLQKAHDRLAAIADTQSAATAAARYAYFEGRSAAEKPAPGGSDAASRQKQVARELAELIAALEQAAGSLDEYAADQSRRVVTRLRPAQKQAAELAEGPVGRPDGEAIRRMRSLAVQLEQAAEMLDSEAPPRALSPIVYDPKTKLYVLFGGDHCDYLTNDTWVFDPARQRWIQRHPPSAPLPRANHTLAAGGDGSVTLSGGYTYTSNTWYCSPQYGDIGDGPWTYDVEANRWTGSGEAVPTDQRVYRTGPFLPEFFLQGPKPDAAAIAKRLAELPANTWVATEPPHLPQLNRDWGTAVLDTDRDMILRFSGGHSAHGGTDVLHYHLSTNRWELPFPVEFPLGQLYSNTSYPEGFNFNLRPWVTGHTYQSYGYAPVFKRMVFAGQPDRFYIYDPTIADWTGRGKKPAGMSYNSCFYTITICPSPHGLYAWTKMGEVYRFDGQKREWIQVELAGGELPGAVVDNSTVVYDSKRDRLLIAVKGYGREHVYDGQVYELDLKTRNGRGLSPGGMAGAADIPYLCQVRYDEANDLLLVGATLPPDGNGLRRTPAFDCAANRWISLRITGDDPSGERGRNVSLGLMYDPKRKLFWAVDTNSRVYVLRLEPKTADPQPLP